MDPSLYPPVRGRFDGIDDTFDPSRGHAVVFTVKSGRKLKKPRTDLVPENERRPCVAEIKSVLSMDAGPRPKYGKLVFGHDISIVGKNRDLLEGDSVTWKVALNDQTLSGEFTILENDPIHLLLKWPEAIPQSAIGRILEFTLASRGGNPEAVRRTTIRQWPII